MRVGDWEPPYHMHQTDAPWGSDRFVDILMSRYQYALEAFGPERCMFESNFPVDKDCISYRTLWNHFKKIANQLGLSETEKTILMKKLEGFSINEIGEIVNLSRYVVTTRLKNIGRRYGEFSGIGLA